MGSVFGELVYGICGPGSQIVMLRAFGTHYLGHACSSVSSALLLLCIDNKSAMTFYCVWPSAAIRSQRSCGEAVERRTPDAMFGRGGFILLFLKIKCTTRRSVNRRQAEQYVGDPSLSESKGLCSSD